MAKTNYGQLKRQKEAAKKARHQKKLDRRQSRTGEDAPVTDGTVSEDTAGEAPVTPPQDERVS